VHVAATFLDVALGGRGVWVATVASPSNMNWAEILGADFEAHLVRSSEKRLRAEFGFVERFDERAARAIFHSGDFQWDGVFLFPCSRGEFNGVVTALADVDVRSDTFANTGEFIHSYGDGIGLRWIHTEPGHEIERITSASIERGFTLVPIELADRAHPN
jgi:hypothetical protein